MDRVTDPMMVTIMMHWMVMVADQGRMVNASLKIITDVGVELYFTNFLVITGEVSLSNLNSSSTM